MSVRVNASGEHLNRTTDLPDATLFTTCFWVNLEAVPGGSHSRICSIRRTDAEYTTLWLEENGGTSRVSTNAGSTVFSPTVPLSEWIFFALQGNDTTAEGYYWAVDDTAPVTASATADSAWSAVNALTYGDLAPAEAEAFADGAYAHIKVWDGVVLTQAELEQERWSVRPVRRAGLHLWCPMFGAAADGTDFSGNARNLTIAGSPTVEDGPPVSGGAFPLIAGAVAAGVVGIDTKDGTAITTGSTLDGQTGIGSADGQAIST